jgi:ligand-binding sensor domain-containing protein
MAKLSAAYSTALVAIKDKPACVVTDNTSLWIGCENGTIHKFTISGGVYLGVVRSLAEKITAMVYVSSGTHLLVATDKGNIYSIAVTLTALEGVSLAIEIGKAIVAMVAVTSTLFVLLNDGTTQEYTLS